MMANAKDRQSHFLWDDPSVITMIAAITLASVLLAQTLLFLILKGRGERGTGCVGAIG